MLRSKIPANARDDKLKMVIELKNKTYAEEEHEWLKQKTVINETAIPSNQ